MLKPPVPFFWGQADTACRVRAKNESSCAGFGRCSSVAKCRHLRQQTVIGSEVPPHYLARSKISRTGRTRSNRILLVTGSGCVLSVARGRFQTSRYQLNESGFNDLRVPRRMRAQLRPGSQPFPEPSYRLWSRRARAGRDLAADTPCVFAPPQLLAFSPDCPAKAEPKTGTRYENVDYC